jgi:hypothetical protein
MPPSEYTPLGPALRQNEGNKPTRQRTTIDN